MALDDAVWALAQDVAPVWERASARDEVPAWEPEADLDDICRAEAAVHSRSLRQKSHPPGNLQVHGKKHVVS